jgi:uroporphyrinogen decarboxylase
LLDLVIFMQETMSPRQRFLTALGCRQPDRVPVWDWVNNPALYQAELGQRPGFYDGGLAVRLSRSLGLDAAWVPAEGFLGLPSGRWHWLDEERFVDEWGIEYRMEAGSWPLAFPTRHPVRDRTDWGSLSPPNPNAAWRAGYAREAVDEAKRAEEEQIAVVGGIRGPFSSAWMLMGLTGMSLARFDAPATLSDIFKATTDFWTQVGLQLLACGVDALVIHDDLGSNSGTFFSPDDLYQLYLPQLRLLVRELAGAGAPVILHSCGNINAVLPDLAGSGISALNNLQRAAGMDLKSIKAAFGEQLCLIGNVDATRFLPTARPAEVEGAVLECLRIAAPGGGYVLATDHSFHAGIPLENVYAFIEAGKQHGSYPI